MAMEKGVRIVSRRMVRPWTGEPVEATKPGSSTAETVHLAPWDLQMLTVDYIQMGVLLPGWPAPAAGKLGLVEHLAQALARALARFYPFAGRLVQQAQAQSADGDGGVTVSLLCTGEGAELVHAVADGAASDVVGSPRIARAVWSLFPLNGLVGADAAPSTASAGSTPVLAAQVTELADGVFVGMSLNHGVADGTAFWHLFNTWAEISRGGSPACSPVLERWFPDACPVPVPLPFPALEHAVRRFHGPPVEECFLAFSADSVRRLKARANAELTAADTVTVSSLQSVLAHVWIAVTRARRLLPEQETTYALALGCRGRVRRVAGAYAGNAMVRCAARARAGEVLHCGGGLGRAARLLHRAVAEARGEAALVASAAAWREEPRFAYLQGWWDPALLVTGNSPRFDAFGNDFGWGRPLAVRSGAGNKVDGRATVYEGCGGGIGMELCLSPEPLARLLDDHDFMAAASR